MPHIQIQNSLICVDEFKNLPIDSIFLLTHFHTDHYDGLTNKHTIWCGELTSKLVKLKFNCKTNILPLNIPIQITKDIIATAIPANHTFESTMFIIEQLNTQNCYLFTGDFKGLNQLPLLQNIHFQKCFIDTTYINLQVQLSQSQAINHIIQAISENIIPYRTKIICQTYSIGKERYFTEIAKQFNIKFYASTGLRRATLKVYYSNQDYKNYFTDVDDNYGTLDYLMQAKRQNQLIQQYKSFQKIIIVYASGWEKTFRVEKHSNQIIIIRAPYSEHSTQQELYQFIRKLNCDELYSICSDSDTDKIREIQKQFQAEKLKQIDKQLKNKKLYDNVQNIQISSGLYTLTQEQKNKNVQQINNKNLLEISFSDSQNTDDNL